MQQLMILPFHTHLNSFINLKYIFNLKGQIPSYAVQNFSCIIFHKRPDDALQLQLKHTAVKKKLTKPSVVCVNDLRHISLLVIC